MPAFRIHRLKDHLRQSFRFAPHLPGAAAVKPRDYEPAEDAAIDATSPYAAFFEMLHSPQPIQVGDVLEGEDGTLCIFKFVGIEEAQWILPEGTSDPIRETVLEVGASA